MMTTAFILGCFTGAAVTLMMVAVMDVAKRADEREEQDGRLN